MGDIIRKLSMNLKAALANKKLPDGLFSGKMGVCIYIYNIARLQNNNELYKLAENLLDEICLNIESVNEIDIENGLMGISLGMDYLLQNAYVVGDANRILKDIDDRIFKFASYGQEEKSVFILLQVLYYIHIRKRTLLLKEEKRLFHELVIQIINTLHSKVEMILKDSTISFNINSNLPLFLFILSKIYQNNICNDIIVRVVKEIIPFVLSKFECTNSQRLYLLWGIDKINYCIKDERLSDYCNILASHIDMDGLLEEFCNKNIFIGNGIAGVYLLLSSLEENEKFQISKDKFDIICKQKIENSLVWDLCDNDEYFYSHIGLNGYCGVAMVWNMIKYQYEK